MFNIEKMNIQYLENRIIFFCMYYLVYSAGIGVEIIVNMEAADHRPIDHDLSLDGFIVVRDVGAGEFVIGFNWNVWNKYFFVFK